MGQCFPLPEDENVRNTMQQHAENHEKIFNMYNFDVVPKPGSDMDKAQKLWDKKEVCFWDCCSDAQTHYLLLLR